MLYGFNNVLVRNGGALRACFIYAGKDGRWQLEWESTDSAGLPDVHVVLQIRCLVVSVPPECSQEGLHHRESSSWVIPHKRDTALE